MSHYCRIKTKIVEKQALIKTLADVGYPHIEDHEKGAQLYGYQGDLRAERANIVIRRKHISPASNDIGFSKTKSGAYEAVVSDMIYSCSGRIGLIKSRSGTHITT